MPGFDSPLVWLLALCGLLAAGVLSWNRPRSQRPDIWGDFLGTDRYLGLSRRGAPRPEESRRWQHVLVIGPADQTTERFVCPNLLLDEGVSVVSIEVGQADGELTEGGPSDLHLLSTFTPHHDAQMFAPFGSLSLRFPLLSVLEAPNTAELPQAAEQKAAGLAEALLHDPDASTGSDPAQDRALLEGLLLDAAARLGGRVLASCRGRERRRDKVCRWPELQATCCTAFPRFPRRWKVDDGDGKQGRSIEQKSEDWRFGRAGREILAPP